MEFCPAVHLFSAATAGYFDPPAAPCPMAPRTEFVPVFKALKGLLKPYAPNLKTVRDNAEWYYLDTHTIGANKKPVMFAAAKIGKNYVSYHLMPVYTGMNADMSPELKKRMQGKACFNFKAVDKLLFGELAELTRKGYDQWRARGWVE
jgi:hypothetical protein